MNSTTPTPAATTPAQVEQPLQHPSARCNECPACRYVKSTGTIVISHSRPAGDGITDADVEMWNTTLRNNPCEHPLVIAYTETGESLKARVVVSHLSDAACLVNTVEYGQITVRKDSLKPWHPCKALEGIKYEALLASLANLPLTWYPALLMAIATAAMDKGVFTTFGASLTLRMVELERRATRLGGKKDTTVPPDQLGYELLESLRRILRCPDLQLENLESETLQAIQEATKLVQQTDTGK